MLVIVAERSPSGAASGAIQAVMTGLLCAVLATSSLNGQERGLLLGVSTPRIPEGTPDNRHPGRVLELLAVQRLGNPFSSSFRKSAQANNLIALTSGALLRELGRVVDEGADAADFWRKLFNARGVLE